MNKKIVTFSHKKIAIIFCCLSIIFTSISIAEMTYIRSQKRQYEAFKRAMNIITMTKSNTITGLRGELLQLEDVKEKMSIENEELKKKITELNKKNSVKKQTNVTTKSKIGVINDIAENANKTFKSYMSKNSISRNSAQGKMLKNAVKDENGVYTLNGYTCVAMGTYYVNVLPKKYGLKGGLGTKYHVTLNTNKTFDVIICDIKSDKHTDSTHRYTVSNGCMMEFIVDIDSLPKRIRTSGSVNGIDRYNGEIVMVEVVG